jgi:hypothetical protein
MQEKWGDVIEWEKTDSRVRVTVDIPEAVYATLREQAAGAGVSMDSLIVQVLEQSYPLERKRREGTRVTGPMLRGKGKLGPRFPVDENPHDLIFG